MRYNSYDTFNKYVNHISKKKLEEAKQPDRHIIVKDWAKTLKDELNEVIEDEKRNIAETSDVRKDVALTCISLASRTDFSELNTTSKEVEAFMEMYFSTLGDNAVNFAANQILELCDKIHDVKIEDASEATN